MRNGDDGRGPPPPPSDDDTPGGHSDLFSSSDTPDAGPRPMGFDDEPTRVPTGDEQLRLGGAASPEGASRIMSSDDRDRVLVDEADKPSRRDTAELDQSTFADEAAFGASSSGTPAPGASASPAASASSHLHLPSIDFSLPPGVGDNLSSASASASGQAELPAHLQLPSFPDFDLPPVPGTDQGRRRLVDDVGIEGSLGGSFGMSDAPPAPLATPAAEGVDPNDAWAVAPAAKATTPPPPPKRSTQKLSGAPANLADLPSLPQIALPSVTKQQTKKEPTLLRADKAEEIAKIQKKSVVGPILFITVLIAGAGTAVFMYRDVIISKIFPDKVVHAEETNTDKARKMVALGQAAFDSNNYPTAIESFEKALVIDPTYAKAHRALGIAYASAKQPDKAVMHYRAYLAMSPTAEDANEVKKIVADYDTRAKEEAAADQAKAAEAAKAAAEAEKAKRKHH